MRDEDTRATSDDGIAGALGAVRHRIEVACRQAGRDAGEVRLLLATKTVPAASVAVAVAGGADLIGENRVQELAEKDDVLADLPCERHLIGHLQSNKVNHALRYVSCIESLDSVELAAKLQRRLDTLDATVEVFLQVNVSGEDSKSGVPPETVVETVREIARRERVLVRGLMTIGLLSPDADAVQAGFRALREARDRLADAAIDGVEATELSMGMSGDLELAVAEGATIVRVGSAVFGRRPPP